MISNRIHVFHETDYRALATVSDTCLIGANAKLLALVEGIVTPHNLGSPVRSIRVFDDKAIVWLNSGQIRIWSAGILSPAIDGCCQEPTECTIAAFDSTNGRVAFWHQGIQLVVSNSSGRRLTTYSWRETHNIASWSSLTSLNVAEELLTTWPTVGTGVVTETKITLAGPPLRTHALEDGLFVAQGDRWAVLVDGTTGVTRASSLLTEGDHIFMQADGVALFITPRPCQLPQITVLGEEFSKQSSTGFGLDPVFNGRYLASIYPQDILITDVHTGESQLHEVTRLPIYMTWKGDKLLTLSPGGRLSEITIT